ncbi:tryptophan synthase subunit alpha [Membranihabitans marinus]|uniref:tryptophan synthase subunit alpha n=1 Tax=Membranihabitans marinus TaxID=1227546 RepID=UPI001EFFBB0E|nr:tryptophan synthase subunit alpha [Membranihabitans marinus]
MNKLKAAFSQGDKKLLNVYFTAGYPQLKDTQTIITSLANAGADIIEVGMPYSDPMADGPTIQESSKIALQNGLTLKILFEQVAAARAQTEVPLILMGYLNQMMQYGEEKFLDSCVQCGIEALIIPDLPPDLYGSDYKAMFEERNIEIVFLITPQTSEDRIRYIDSLSDAFIYVVSDSSITGNSRDISSEQREYFQRIADMNLKNPCLIGFGISDKKSFDMASSYSSGAIIGSAFIKHLTNASGDESLDLTVTQFVHSIKG